jgi:hypothetical protein
MAKKKQLSIEEIILQKSESGMKLTKAQKKMCVFNNSLAAKING